MPVTETAEAVLAQPSLIDYLAALSAAHSNDPIALTYGDDVVVEVTDAASIEAAVVEAGDEALYMHPVTTGGDVFYLYTFTENADPESWRDLIGITPTAVVFKGGDMICAYALEHAARADDPALIALAKDMGCVLTDPIPTPGANGWTVVACDEDIFTPIADLVTVFGSEPPAPTVNVPEVADYGWLNNAKLLTPGFSLDDPRYQQEMVISTGDHRESKRWIKKPMSIAQNIALLSVHREDKKKDGLAFVLAEIIGLERKKAAVRVCYAIGLDIDVGVPGVVIDDSLIKAGITGVRYTTHSHAKTSSKLLKDRITRWAKKHDLGSVDQAVIQRFLREESRWDEGIIETVEYAGDVQEPEGFMVDLRHKAMPKHRVIVYLAAGVELTKIGETHDEGMKKWAKACYALAKLLGDLPLDRSAIDPSRLFYFARHAPGAAFEVSIAGGRLLSFDELDLDGVGDAAEPGTFEALLEAEIKTDEKTKSKSTTEHGRDLGHWSKDHADRFQIVDLIRDHADDRIRTNGNPKIDIECAFDEEHSDPGNPEDKGCFAVNAGEGESPVFTLKCQHDSCANRTNLDHLGKMLADGWFSREALDDDSYYSEPDDVAAPVVIKGASAAPPTTDDIREAIKALPPKKEGPDVKPLLDMIARLDDYDDRETMIGLLRGASGRTVGDLRKGVAERRKGPAKKNSVDADVVVNPKTGFRTLTFKGEPDDIRARAFLLDRMNQVNSAENMPLFTVNRGAPSLMRRYDGQISFEELEPRNFQAALFEHCAFAQAVEEGELTHKAPYADICGLVHAGLRPGELPNQPSIRRAPSIGADGQVMKDNGWFGDVVVDLGNLEAPDVPDAPTAAQVVAARELLVDTLLGDFPFDDDDDLGAQGESKASTANAVGMVLTQFCRDLFTGPSPLFAIVKPAPGVGGTLLAEVPQRLFDGFPSTTTPNSSREDEMEKLMSSAAMGNESCMFFDNVRNFQSDTVKRTCTSDKVGGRKLGSSQMVWRPNNMLWQITGINPTLDAEINRRCVYMNLNLRRASSAKRNYQHPDFKGWLTENRSRIIGAILTLIRAWWVAGKKPGTTVLSSFESWSGVIGGVLEHAGIEGFLTNPRPETEDYEGTETKEFVAEWVKVFKDREASEKEAFEALAEDTGYGGEQRRRNFNTMVRSLKGRTFEFDQRLLMFAQGAPGCWRVVEIKAVSA